MKYQKIKKILSSFLLLAILAIGTSQAYASEVIGTLSAGGSNTSGNSGTVAGGGASGGGSSRTSRSGTSGGNSATTPGSVLGASTGPASNSVSSDGTALEPQRSVAVNYGTGVSSTNAAVTPEMLGDQTETPVDYSPAATAAGAESGLSGMTWFWIILLLLLLAGIIGYIYNRDRKNSAERLH